MDNAINYRILYGFPINVINEAKENLKNRNITAKGEKGSYIRDMAIFVFNDDTFIRNIFPEELQKDLDFIRILISDPQPMLTGRYPCHTDSDRKAAINIPIKVAHNSGEMILQDFYISKHEDINCHAEEYIKMFDTKPYPSKYFKPDRYMVDYDFYEMTNTIAMNPCMPHGFRNISNQKRIIITLGFLNTDYNTLLSKLPQEWLTNKITDKIV